MMFIEQKYIVCLIVAIFIILLINLVICLKRKKLAVIIKDKKSIISDLMEKNKSYMPIRLIDPGFVVYNTTYQDIPDDWKRTVYYSERYTINGWATYSLDPSSWKDCVFSTDKDTMCSSYNRYALHCSMCKATERGPVLILEDPFSSIITEPIPNLTNNEAEKLVGRILFLTMTIFPLKNTCTVSSIVSTNLYLYGTKKGDLRLKEENTYLNLAEYFSKEIENFT